MKKLAKYLEVARVALRSQVTYLWDLLLSTLFLVVIMFVFVQLWKVTYAATPSSAFAGYGLPQIIWYLVATESIVTSLPRIHSTIDGGVKNGDLALRLNKPYSYLLFHYSTFLSQGLLQLGLKLAVGGLTAYLLVGGFRFYWPGIPALLLIYLTTQAINFCYSAAVGLAAFWLEDITGLYFVVDRLKWILGGMLLPLELYPDSIRTVVERLPFRYMIAGPAHLFVYFNWAEAGRLLAAQGFWTVLFSLLCWLLYRMGVRRVDVNGG